MQRHTSQCLQRFGAQAYCETMDMRQQINAITGFLDSRGVRWKSTRIDRLITNLQSQEFCGPFDDRQADRLLAAQHALRDLDELFQIATHATDAPAEDLRKLVGDNEIARLDGETPGRNKQLELYSLATLRKGGAKSRLAEPPDVVTEIDRVWVGAACKRLRSRKRFDDRIDEALDQIRRSGLCHGIAIVDVSVAFNPEYSWIKTARPDLAVGDELVARLHRNLRDIDRSISRAFASESRLLGILWIDMVFIDAGNGCRPHRVSLLSTRDAELKRSPVADRLSHAVLRTWMKGVGDASFVDSNWPRRVFENVNTEQARMVPSDTVVRMRPQDGKERGVSPN